MTAKDWTHVLLETEFMSMSLLWESDSLKLSEAGSLVFLKSRNKLFLRSVEKNFIEL